MALGELDAFVGIDVSEDQQDRIRGRVVRLERISGRPPKSRRRDRQNRRKNCGRSTNCDRQSEEDRAREAAVGLIEHVDAHFLFHDVALVAQIFVVHLERAHAVGLEPQDALQSIRGTDS